MPSGLCRRPWCTTRKHNRPPFATPSGSMTHATPHQPPDQGHGAIAVALLAVALACALLCSLGCNHVETAVGTVTIDLHLAADVTAEITGPQGERIATIITTRKDVAACAPFSPSPLP